MAQEIKATSGVEWRISMGDGSSKSLAPEAGVVSRVWLGLKGWITGLVLKVWRFFKKAWDLGVEEPRKVVHCLKAGMALTVVSLFYYMRPLYEGVGGNAMWAIMTVIVVFENTVGATICKSLNRVCGTTLAGFLGLGVQWIATQSGEKFESLIIGTSVFLFASAATFSRFIPTVKRRFDYGAMIFILTFSLVTVSGYRVDKLFDLAHQRISTIIIGTSFCIIVIVLICPIWAGQELHMLITCNMDKLANSLDGCVAEFFNINEELVDNNKQPDKKLLGYKCVLSSKSIEETMANFARWEPAHGPFTFRHPWKQYLKIGASLRSCAYCIETLNGCIESENLAITHVPTLFHRIIKRVPEFIKKHLSNVCLTVSYNSSSVIRKLTKTIRTMEKSPTVDSLVKETNSAVVELQNALKSLPNLFNGPEPQPPESKEPETISELTVTIPLVEVMPVVTLASLLIEIAARIQGIVDAVEELAKLAEFKVAVDDKTKQNQPNTRIVVPSQLKDEETMKAPQRV